MRVLAVGALLLLASGCASIGHPAPLLPQGWSNGVPLSASSTLSKHDGGHEAVLVPNATLARPVSCLTYRGNASATTDSCEVRDAPSYLHAPWMLYARWAGCPGGDWNGCHGASYPEPYKARVVAFDERGEAVAWWDGRSSPTTNHSTE